MFDADGNVIYKPKDRDELVETQGSGFVGLNDVLYLLDLSAFSSWDHAEFYVIVR